MRFSLSLLLCVGLAQAQQTRWFEVDASPASADGFRAAAAKVAFLDLGAVLYGRPSHAGFPRKEQEAYAAAMREIRSPRYSVELLAQLSEDADAKVRALAIVALFEREQATLLPIIAGRIGDVAQGPGTVMPFSIRLDPKNPTRRTRPQIQPLAVGGLVQRLLQFWDPRLRATPAAFAAWWKKRQGRELLMCEVAVRAKRAGGGTTDIRAWKPRKLYRFIPRRGSKPSVLQDLAFLLAFTHDAAPKPGVVQSTYPGVVDDLRFACRRLGPDRLMRLLQGEALIDDPDWQTDANLREPVRRWVLDHAHENLLTAQHVDALRALGRSRKEARCFRAAARLQPAKANAILREAIKLLTHPWRAFEVEQCAELLWELAPEQSTRFLTRWFFESYDGKKMLGSSPARTAFVGMLCRRFGPREKQLLASLVRDERFAELDPRTVKAFVEWLSKDTRDPLATDLELRRLSHPYGMSHFDAWLEKGKKEHPAATRAVLELTEKWRVKVRAHVKDW